MQRYPYRVWRSFNKKNVTQLHNYLLNNKTNIVVNQWGLHWIPIKTIQKAKKGLSVKTISVYHNDPLKNGILQKIDNQISNTDNFLKRHILLFKRFFFRCITGFSMRYVYKNSDIYEVLSNSFVENFKEFTKIKNTNKLFAQTNPITINNSDYTYNFTKKSKEIIYVGRLDNTQKCVYRIIEIWDKLEKKYPDWHLTIVGDGNDRIQLEKMISNLQLKHVKLEGMQYPRQYYERASILLLTSDFEGFGLVIVEGMAFGVIPIAYGSYSAVYDIIENEKDGIITPMPYNVADFVSYLHKLLDDKIMRQRMANNAIEKSKKFSLDNIASEWYSKMNKLLSQ